MLGLSASGLFLCARTVWYLDCVQFGNCWLALCFTVHFSLSSSSLVLFFHLFLSIPLLARPPATYRLTKEKLISRNKVKRVLTQRQILATANHPFIIAMFASFQTSLRLCFVMEYAAGGEFFKVLQRQPNKRLREDAARFHEAEVTLALEYLHHLGFIYRDLIRGRGAGGWPGLGGRVCAGGDEGVTRCCYAN